MNTYVYCVHFIKPNIKTYIPAVLGEIAVTKAEKLFMGIDLGNKVNVWRVE
jgi:hypothetical protein